MEFAKEVSFTCSAWVPLFIDFSAKGAYTVHDLRTNFSYPNVHQKFSVWPFFHGWLALLYDLLNEAMFLMSSLWMRLQIAKVPLSNKAFGGVCKLHVLLFPITPQLVCSNLHHGKRFLRFLKIGIHFLVQRR